MVNPRIWTRDEVAARIIAGDILLVKDGLVLKIPQSWLEKHPGGRLAILHFVGRDATDEIHAYHPDATLRQMEAFVVGRIECSGPTDCWQPLVPPVTLGWRRVDDTWTREAEAATHSFTKEEFESRVVLVERSTLDESTQLRDGLGPTASAIQPLPSALCAIMQQQHSAAYAKLHQKIKDNHLYTTSFVSGYGPELCRYLTLAALSATAYTYGWFLLSATFLGFLWHQLTFIAHDLGHNGVTHNRIIDRILGIIVAGLCGGLSIGWWVDNHNIHHLVTNHPSHDPDIQHIPFMAITPNFSLSLWSSYYQRSMKFDMVARFFTKLQHMYFYALVSVGRFNFYGLSYTFLAKRLADKQSKGGKRLLWLEVAFIAIYWWWYTAVLRGCGNWKTAVAYLLISHIVTSPLHVQVILSHFARSTEDLGPLESFPHRQLRTTTDIICPKFLEFFHGGLHLQVTHHLFPRLPRHNLKRASVLVKKFAEEQGLEYAEFGFVDANVEVHGVLKSVAHQIGIMQVVADSCI